VLFAGQNATPVLWPIFATNLEAGRR
jgi:hypothetical protein